MYSTVVDETHKVTVDEFVNHTNTPMTANTLTGQHLYKI